MPQQPSNQIAALMGSRICHDLISPLGAIGNGIELLEMGLIDPSPELALISESVQSANARIKFFRIAYGFSDLSTQIAGTEVSAILADYCRTGKTTIHWQDDDNLSRGVAKLIFLLIQCLETALPYGGSITVQKDNGHYIITGKGDDTKIDPNLWALISNATTQDHLRPAQVQFALAPLTAEELSLQIAVECSDHAITIRI